MPFVCPYLMDRMKNVVLLGLTAILGSSLVGAFRCHECSVKEPGQKCIPDHLPCITKAGDSCFVQQLFLEQTSLSITAGCSSQCKAEDNGHFLRLVTKCCSTDLCNVP